MKKLKMNYLSHVLSLICFLIIIPSCGDDGIFNNDGGGTKVSSSADANGNLVIDNKTDKTLLLYHEGSPIKEIQANQNSFIVNVPTDGFSTSLKVWEKDIVVDVDNPIEDNKLRQWDVVLPPSSVDENSRALWIIKDDGSSTTASGTLEFNYPDIDSSNEIPVIYSVDVILDNQTGSKITSLAPGTVNKKVGVEYGYRVLLFQYWYSDQNSTIGRQDVDWKLKDENGEDYSAILNANYPNAQIDVPIYYFSPIGRKAEIIFDNNSDNDIQVFTNGDLIENLVITDQPTQGLSLIRQDSLNISFIVPEGQYLIDINTISSGEMLENKSVRLIELYPFYWNLDGYNNYHQMTIINKTGKRVTLHDLDSGRYIGYWLDDEESLTIDIEDSINSVEARAWLDSSKTATTANTSQTWTINELN